jgi:circadian clock protein KaiB
MARRKIPESDRQVYVLRLYVTGASAVSARAIANLKALCEQRLKGRFQLEVIDILQNPALAEGEHIIAAPTLVRVLPAPLRRFIGDLSDLDGKLFGLDARPN